MRDRILKRIEELRQEFEAGQTRLREMDTQQAILREKVVRISGAILVLEELLEAENGTPDGGRNQANE